MNFDRFDGPSESFDDAVSFGEPTEVSCHFDAVDKYAELPNDLTEKLCGVRSIEKDFGVVESIGRDENDHAYKEYSLDGDIIARHVHLGDMQIERQCKLDAVECLSATAKLLGNIVESFVEGDLTSKKIVGFILEEPVVEDLFCNISKSMSEKTLDAMEGSSSSLVNGISRLFDSELASDFSTELYSNFSKYALGKITLEEFASNLCCKLEELSNQPLGDVVRIAHTGAFLGNKIAGVPGAVVGSIVGGTIGCVIATESYSYAIEKGSEYAEAFSSQAKLMANSALDLFSTALPEKLEDARTMFVGYLDSKGISI